MADEWVTEAELEAMKQPLDPPGLYEAVAQAKLRRKAVAAADTVIDLALNAQNEGVRLRAATYLIDRALGPVANPHNANAGDDAAPWTKVYGAMLVEPAKSELPNVPSYHNPPTAADLGLRQPGINVTTPPADVAEGVIAP